MGLLGPYLWQQAILDAAIYSFYYLFNLFIMEKLIPAEKSSPVIRNAHTPVRRCKIGIPSTEGIEFFFPEQIVRCESDSNYTRIFLLDNRKMIIAMTLKKVEQLMTQDFLRVHQSHLVNQRYMTKYVNRDGYYLVMEDGTSVPVSRSKRPLLLGFI